MFVVVSGYFSGTEKGLQAIKKHTVRILPPYFIFQTLFTIVSFAYTPPTLREFIGSFVVPRGVLWYLWCLFVWRIVLSYFVELPHPITLSLLIGVLSGFFPKYGVVLSISRMFTFFPYFVIGYFMKEFQVFVRFLNIRGTFKRLSIYILLLVLIGSFFVHGQQYDNWLYGKIFYAEMGHGEWYSMIFRLVTYVVGFIVGFSFLLLVPRKTSPVTMVGRRTLYVYLWHGLLVCWCWRAGWLKEITNLTHAVLIVLSGIPLSLLLSLNMIRALTRVLIEPGTLLRVGKESR